MIIPSFDSYKRFPISPNTRRQLINFLLDDFELPGHGIESDWDEVFQAVCRNGLIGLTYAYLTRKESNDAIPEKFRAAIRKAYEVSALKIALMYNGITTALELLNQSGIPYMVVKGPVLGSTVYSSRFMRGFNDLDILVRESNWAVIDHFLVEHGYKRDLGEPEPPPKLIPQDVKQETHYVNEKAGLLIEVHYDDILNSGLASRDMEGYWERSIEIDINGAPVKTLSIEDQLIHLATHLHHHAYSRLIWFADIKLFLEKNSCIINWSNLIETVNKEECQVPVFYSFTFLEKILGVKIPQYVMQAIRPSKFQRILHERIWPESRVLSFQPLADVYFSFYFIPFYQRLLPDFLVMGRRAEKLDYLFHLLIPSKEWIKHHYHLRECDSIIFYRVFHPFRLLSVFINETIFLLSSKFPRKLSINQVLP